MKLIIFELQQKYSINFNHHKINNHSPTAKPNLKYVTNINYIYMYIYIVVKPIKHCL